MKFGVLCVLALLSVLQCVLSDTQAIQTSPSAPSNILCNCLYNYEPVCGSDKQSYYNKCFLDCENDYRKQNNLKPIWVAYEFTCLTVSCNCPNTNAPVCDVYGNSYINYCYYDCANRQYIKEFFWSIPLSHNGLCWQDPCACPLISSPVCASNDVTFGNSCLLACENAKRANQFPPLPPLGQKAVGECPAVVPPFKCTDLCVTVPFQLLCGSDNINYFNICYLMCASLEALTNNKPGITIKKIGMC